MSRKSCYLALGQKLRKTRKMLGLKQIDLAVEADLNRTYISRIETGQARVTFKVLSKLIDALNSYRCFYKLKPLIWTI